MLDDTLTRTARRQPSDVARRPDRGRAHHLADRPSRSNLLLLRERDTNYDYAGQDPINGYDLNGTMHGEGNICGSLHGAALKTCAYHRWPYALYCSIYKSDSTCKSDFHPFAGRTLSCLLFVAGVASGGAEIYEYYRGIRAGKDAVQLAIDFAKRYLGKAKRNQLHIGGFSAGVAGSALTGGCLP